MTEINQGKRSQRRRDFRSDCCFPFYWRALKGSSQNESEETPWQRSWTRDLSAGGASFYAPPESPGVLLEPSQLIEFQLLIPKRPVFGIAQVKRLIQDDSSREQFLAIEFSSIEPADRDRIAGVVLNYGLTDRMENIEKV